MARGRCRERKCQPASGWRRAQVSRPCERRASLRLRRSRHACPGQHLADQGRRARALCRGRDGQQRQRWDQRRQHPVGGGPHPATHRGAALKPSAAPISRVHGRHGGGLPPPRRPKRQPQGPKQCPPGQGEEQRDQGQRRPSARPTVIDRLERPVEDRVASSSEQPPRSRCFIAPLIQKG